MNSNTVTLQMVVCALLAMAPNALLIHAVNVTTSQAQAAGENSPTSERAVDSSTAGAVLVD
jgi:hypothetical protein